MEKKRIVWIDDDIYSPILRPYIDEFEENNFEVVKIKDIDNLLPILVDIIMPPQNLDFSKTRGGLRTGIVVIENILNDVTLKNIPIVAFTNVDDLVVNNFFRNKSIMCLEKKNYFSNEFVAKIDSFIDDSNNRRKRV